MLLKCFNWALINDREKTYLTADAAAAATTLTVATTSIVAAATSSNIWSDNDYILVGEIGQETTEIMQMAAAVTSATSLTIDREGSAGGLRHAHPKGTPVYRIDYNRAEFSRAPTESGTKTVLTTKNITPDSEFTSYEDTTNTTGYGFARFATTAGVYSAYSDGVNYSETGEGSSRDPRTLWMMRKKVRQLLDEDDANSKLTDSRIDEAINDKQREVAHLRLWSFYEDEKSLSAVANQFVYDIPTTVNKIHGVKFDTQPLRNINKAEWDLRHFDTDQSTTDPYGYMIWNNRIWLYPRPSSNASTTTLGAAISSATATSITVADSSDFHRGDFYRLIIDSEVIYATASTATTFTGCLRGQEGTTATTHSNGATVTERDIVFSCNLEPTDLVDTQDRTSIPEAEVLTYGAAVDLAPFVGLEQGTIDRFEMRYKIRIKELEEKFSAKQTLQHGRIKDMNERLVGGTYYDDQNRYPSSVNT